MRLKAANHEDGPRPLVSLVVMFAGWSLFRAEH